MALNDGVAPLRAEFALRAELLGAARTRVLGEDELVHAGRMFYGRPEGLSVYGVPAPSMVRRGLRLLGRTAIECSVDEHCADFAAAVATHLAGEPDLAPGFVADLFCGSGNLGWHLGTRLGLPVFAAELDPGVYAATRHNFEVMGIDVDLRHGDYRDLLTDLPSPRVGDIHLVEPPWGPALTERGLDLAATDPPVPEILASIRASRAGVPCLVVLQVVVVGPADTTTRPSLARCFAGARHVTTIHPTAATPGGATVEFHVYELPG
jgi:hypothetical protein